MHVAAVEYDASLDNPRGRAWRESFAMQVASRLTREENDLIAAENRYQGMHDDTVLPQGVIHGDYFDVMRRPDGRLYFTTFAWTPGREPIPHTSVGASRENLYDRLHTLRDFPGASGRLTFDRAGAGEPGSGT